MEGMSTLTLPEDVAADFLALPPDAQYAAAQFIAFLRRQSKPAPANDHAPQPPSSPKRRKSRIPLSQEPIVGMWRDRPEMEDSVEYVRQMRKREFRDPHA